MTLQGFRSTFFVATLAAALLIAPGLRADDTTSVAAQTPASPHRLWVETCQIDPMLPTKVSIELGQEYDTSTPVKFNLVIFSRDAVPESDLHFTVQANDDRVVYEGTLNGSLVEDQNEGALIWDASALPSGVYLALLDARKASGKQIGNTVCQFVVVSEQELRDEVAGATQALDAAETPDESAALLSDLRVSLAIARDALTVPEKAWDAEWRPLRQAVAFGCAIAASLTDKTSDASAKGEQDTSAGYPDLSKMVIREGAFSINETPVYPFGIQEEAIPFPETVKTFHNYGLGLVAATLAPDDVLGSGPGVPDWQTGMTALVQTANQNGMALFCELAPQRLDTKGIQEPTALEPTPSHLTDPEVQAAIKQYLDAVVPFLAGQKNLGAIGIAEEPAFHFEGEDLRQGFARYAFDAYDKRDDLNRSWQTHIRHPEDVKVDWMRDRFSYQQDLQRYHRIFGTQILEQWCNAVRKNNPHIPLYILYRDDFLLPGSTRSGVDQVALAKTLDINGCAAATHPQGSGYAVEFPGPILSYTLLQSLAPDMPIINTRARLMDFGTESARPTPAYVSTVVWEGIMAGLDAVAVPEAEFLSHSGELKDAELFNAFCRAALDVNRLGSVIHAFQQAPVELAILWSDSARMFDDGSPFLASVRETFTAASFTGLTVRFVTSEQVAQGILDRVTILVIPETLAVPDATFEKLEEYIEGGGLTVCTASPMPYNERGHSRYDVLSVGSQTVLVRGTMEAKQFLNALDAALTDAAVPLPPRVINRFGYPIEGIRTRCVRVNGTPYLYLANLRTQSVRCWITEDFETGHDLIGDRDVQFPLDVPSLDPMLIQLDNPPVAVEKQTVPESVISDSAVVEQDNKPAITGFIKPVTTEED